MDDGQQRLLDPAHIQWSRRQFDLTAENGIWGLPATGLVFQRRGNTLVLIEIIPIEDAPFPEDKMKEFQLAMYDECRKHFEAAGITVTREV